MTEPRRSAERGLSVLVVDDSPAMRSLTGRALLLSGLPVIEVLEAGDGVSALEILAGRDVDIVLSDINMPRMNGWQLVGVLRSQAGNKRIPVVMISMEPPPHGIESICESGADGYLAKPFHPELLRAEVERVLRL